MNAGEEYAQRRTYAGMTPRDPSTMHRLRTFTTGNPSLVLLPRVARGNRLRFGRFLVRITFGCSCLADTQRLIEGTIGFWFSVHQGPHGRIQFGPQYSYVAQRRMDRDGPDAHAIHAAPHGLDNMFFTSIRYYLP